ncbi:MAG: Fur family transcriptional regulator [Thermoleophilaceae bacterium]
MATMTIDTPLIAKLREREMRVTSQRLVIHRVLCERDQHMTAEQVLAAVSDVLPGTSLPTVYATLELLEELALVRRVGTGSTAVLFDSRLAPHAHTVCRGCGAVADLDGVAPSTGALRRARQSGFAPDSAQLVVWGLCPACSNPPRTE